MKPTTPRYWTIRKSFSGGWLITMPCPITGRRQDAHIGAHCGIGHINAVAKWMSKKWNPSAQEVAIMAEDRMNRAIAIRSQRNKTASYKQEVCDIIDCGLLPTIGQLRRAGML